MSENTTQNHPDIETLANYTAGLLNERDADNTRTHLETCQLCRLEIKRIERFERIDSDTDLQAEADWQAARVALERTFQEKVLPQVVRNKARAEDGGGVADRMSFWTRWQLRWLVPVAAAVAVALIAVRVVEWGGPGDDVGPMRGPTTESFDISTGQPLGDIAGPPVRFTWKSRRENDSYTIEIYTSDLTKIYQQDGITESHWAASDSLKSLLELDTIYLWSVTGHKSLERETVSPNAWFKIAPPQETGGGDPPDGH
jgi:hypothetical protein